MRTPVTQKNMSPSLNNYHKDKGIRDDDCALDLWDVPMSGMRIFLIHYT